MEQNNEQNSIETKEIVAPVPESRQLDLLGQQMVNELRAMLQKINETYEGFYHFKLFNLIDLNPEECTKCNEAAQQCLRCIISFDKMQQ